MATTTDAIGVGEATRVSFEEFEQMPEKPGKQELLEGELVELPPPGSKHGRSSHRIYDAMKVALAAAHSREEALDLGEVFIEMGYRLGKNSYVQPDVSVTRAGQPEGQYFENAPAIAIEVISPANRAQHVEKKLALYFQHGAREVWHLYRNTRRFVVYEGKTARVLSEDETLTTALLPGFALRIKDILG